MSELPRTMRQAVNLLVNRHEFYASLLLEMRFVEVEKEPPKTLAQPGTKTFAFTMGTDGRSLFYSRPFVDSITTAVCAFALVHEVCHPMLQHLTRIYKHNTSTAGWTPHTDSQGRLLMRDPTLWNIAGDHVINLMLQVEGFTLWKDCLADPQYRGLSTEEVYAKLIKDAKQKPEPQEETGEGDPVPGSVSVPGMGGDLVEPGSAPGSESDPTALEEEWKDRIVRAATIARQRGKLPAHLEGFITEITTPQYPVWHLLQHYVDEVCSASDSSWYRPHPHFLPQGIILPGPYSDRVAHVCVFYDTSGSVSNEELSRFHRIGGDIIREAQPGLLTLGQCDADVHSYTEIHSQADWPTEMKCTGRGGTSFRPPFAYLEERNIRPSLMIYLTDLEGDFPEFAPPYPVLWVSTTNLTAPWGTTIHLDKE